MKWKNIAAQTTTFFITATITEWQPLFADARARDILLNDLRFYRKKYGCRILAYVIMPEHYHLVVELNRPEDLHGWLHDVQLHTSNEVKKWLKATVSPKELAVFERHANGHFSMAVWKEQARALEIISAKVLKTKINYLHNNPVKRGLVADSADWPWSSSRFYNYDDESVFQVDRVDILQSISLSVRRFREKGFPKQQIVP